MSRFFDEPLEQPDSFFCECEAETPDDCVCASRDEGCMSCGSRRGCRCDDLFDDYDAY